MSHIPGSSSWSSAHAGPARPPWPIKWAILGTLCGAIVGLVAIFLAFRYWLGSPRIANVNKLSTNDLFNLLKLVFAVVASVGGVVALVVAYRRQKILEESNRLSALAQFHTEQVDAGNLHDATERRVTELYGQAVEQLGHGKAAVRLGGLYSLERLAQDHCEHRQTVVDVICAYLRMHYAPASTPTPTTQTAPNRKDEELQVRLTAQRILARHLRIPDERDAGTSESDSHHWRDIKMDLAGAYLLDFDLADCILSSADFTAARFAGRARFNNSKVISEAIFSSATFEGGADFVGMRFELGASFTGCTFEGQASWRLSQFRGNSGFNRCEFRKTAFFEGATFAGTTWFRKTHFLEDAIFKEARFEQHTVFDNSQFHHDAVFSDAHFGQKVQFQSVEFMHLAQFTRSTIAGDVTFRHSNFKITPRFTVVMFGSKANFAAAESNKKFDMAGSTASAPNGLHVWPLNWQIAPTTPAGKRGPLVEILTPIGPPTAP